MQNIGLDGQESNCMELLALCTVLSMLLPWTDLRSLHWHSQAQSTGREMLQAGSKAISHKVLAMSAVPVVLHSAWSTK
jgi:hypothetical protein